MFAGLAELLGGLHVNSDEDDPLQSRTTRPRPTRSGIVIRLTGAAARRLVRRFPPTRRLAVTPIGALGATPRRLSRHVKLRLAGVLTGAQLPIRCLPRKALIPIQPASGTVLVAISFPPTSVACGPDAACEPNEELSAGEAEGAG